MIIISTEFIFLTCVGVSSKEDACRSIFEVFQGTLLNAMCVLRQLYALKSIHNKLLSENGVNHSITKK